MNDSRPEKKKDCVRFLSIAAGQKRRLITPQRSHHAEAKTVRRFGNFFLFKSPSLVKNNVTLFHLTLSGREKVVFLFVHSFTDSAAV